MADYEYNTGGNAYFKNIIGNANNTIMKKALSISCLIHVAFIAGVYIHHTILGEASSKDINSKFSYMSSSETEHNFSIQKFIPYSKNSIQRASFDQHLKNIQIPEDDFPDASSLTKIDVDKKTFNSNVEPQKVEKISFDENVLFNHSQNNSKNPFEHVGLDPVKAQHIKAWEKYKQLVKTRVKCNAQKLYLLRYGKGIVCVNFTLTRNGTLYSVSVDYTKSRANKNLVLLAKNSVRKVNKFPPFPAGQKEDKLDFRLAIKFIGKKLQVLEA